MNALRELGLSREEAAREYGLTLDEVTVLDARGVVETRDGRTIVIGDPTPKERR